MMILLGLLLTFSQAERLDLRFGEGVGSLTIRFEFPVNPEPINDRWTQFLRKYFDYFDANSDGQLQRSETPRLFPLPILGKDAKPFDFAQADEDRNAAVSFPEFIQEQRRTGFRPLVTILEQAGAESNLLARRLETLLDRDADGIIDQSEWKRAKLLINRFDLNEDEFLTPAELLEFVEPATTAGKLLIREESLLSQPFVTFEIIPQDRHSILRYRGASKSWDAARKLIRDKAVTLRLTDQLDRGQQFRNSVEFFETLFEQALAGRSSLTQKQVAQDPGLRAIADVFSHADRNQDGTLSASEHSDFLKLIQLGLNCQEILEVTDLGINLFQQLDIDHDGRLSFYELSLVQEWPDTRIAGLPRQYRVQLSRGLPVDRFGPVSLPRPKLSEPVRNAVNPMAPAWFVALDHNRDGFLSSLEFLGSPARFQEFDQDRDGRISPAEANRLRP